ncbi:hypothetical protein WN093_06610 [Gammaproteobacteria bacterium AS21]|mgnify:CR=1 FL=1|jgi:hypothetical protein
MTVRLKKAVTLTLATTLIVALAACAPGAAQRTGKKVDDIILNTGNAIENVCENIKESLDTENTDC